MDFIIRSFFILLILFLIFLPKYAYSQSSKQDQFITTTPIPDKKCTDSVFKIAATASSGLPVIFKVESGSAFFKNDTIHFNAIDFTNGKVQTSILIRVSQPGNAVYNAASDEFLSFQIHTDFWNEFGNKSLFKTLDTNVYEGETLAVEVESIPGISYEWTTPQADEISSSNISFPNATTSLSGIYQLNISEGKCLLYGASLKLSVLPQRLNQIINISPIAKKTCLDSIIPINATTNSGLKVELSLPNEEGVLKNDTLYLSKIDFTKKDTEKVVLVKASQSGNSSYYPAADVMFSVSITSGFWNVFSTNPIYKKPDTLGYIGEHFSFELETLTGISYRWRTPQNTYLLQPNLDFPIADISMTGIYQLEINEGMCALFQSSFRITIVQKPEFPILVYNIVTPNQDNKNDNLYIENIDQYGENELIVTDLWGNTIFASANYKNTWSPTHVAAGEYFYNLKIGKKMYSGGFLVLK